MQTDPASLDAHEQPSDELRAIWKAFSRTDQKDLLADDHIDELTVSGGSSDFRQAGSVSSAVLRAAYAHFLHCGEDNIQVERDAGIFYHPILPGTFEAPCRRHTS